LALGNRLYGVDLKIVNDPVNMLSEIQHKRESTSAAIEIYTASFLKMCLSGSCAALFYLAPVVAIPTLLPVVLGTVACSAI